MRTAKFRTTPAPGPCAFVKENVNGLPGLRWYCEAVRTSATASRASSAWNIRPATIFGRSITVPYARLNPPIGWNVTGRPRLSTGVVWSSAMGATDSTWGSRATASMKGPTRGNSRKSDACDAWRKRP